MRELILGLPWGMNFDLHTHPLPTWNLWETPQNSHNHRIPKYFILIPHILCVFSLDVVYALCTYCDVQELIRRWESERELFNDDIAHVLQNTKKWTHFDRLTNVGKYCALNLEFMNLLQNFHLLHLWNVYTVDVAWSLCIRLLLGSNRKLSIVMALSTTFTQCAPENYQIR